MILDLIPVVGDVAAAALGSYMIWEARNLGMSKWQMSRMAGNVGVDFLLGLIPFVGLIPDFFFRSNSRNLQIIKRHLDKHHAAGATVEATASSPSRWRSCLRLPGRRTRPGRRRRARRCR